uniref:ATP-binding cassette domain-containing protein n=1 Tax=Paracoccus seriniphilus TaxID=184748 RepID=UPI00356AE809
MSFAEIRDLKLGAVTDSGRKVDIIKGVSLKIDAGEIVALIGESGSGKTTIALSLMGYVRPGCHFKSGSVTVDGVNMVAASEATRAKMRGTNVAYVPQSAAAGFNPAHRLIDQVIETARIHDLMPMEQARAKA